ncbi:hypothetical protein ACKFRM_07805 [Corynebacterium sp. YSMAA1_1_D6]|uniref:hypothetical protein n=1 Tax=Corynebacterium sp. YSMAA1_1_D6 TaxID=3383589 RepID=UPI0026012975|nr:hypothetical protein [uncultured Corynebacterium sp.]
MRNFRTAAVAAATAVSVAFAGTSVAVAAEAEQEDNLSSVISSAGDEVKENDSDESLSSKWGTALDKNEPVAGVDAFGKETDPNRADWSKVATAGLYTAIGTAVASALVAAYNFAVYNHIVPAHVLDPIFR